MHRKRMAIPVFGLFFLAFLAACSSEGDTSSAPPAPLPAALAEGYWSGTTNTDRTITGVVLDNGVYWILYSAVGAPSTVAGLIQGDSNSQNGVFTSSNARDFKLEGQGILDATINGSFTTKQSLNGTIAYTIGGQSTFTTTYNNEYELIPDMNAAAGTYTGPITATETVTVDVLSNGDISGRATSGGTIVCTFSGSFSPRARGNVFDITVTFHGQSGCDNGANTVNGIATYDGGTKTLYSAALNDDRTNGFIFIGTKP